MMLLITEFVNLNFGHFISSLISKIKNKIQLLSLQHNIYAKSKNIVMLLHSGCVIFIFLFCCSFLQVGVRCLTPNRGGYKYGRTPNVTERFH